MREYKHKKTGAVIRTASVINAPDWEMVEPKKPAPKKETKKKKRGE